MATMLIVNTLQIPATRKVGRPRKVAVFSKNTVIAIINDNPIDALYTLFNGQMYDENEHTLYVNNIGFSVRDGRKAALWIQACETCSLQEYDFENISRVCAFYWQQLGKILFKI